MKKLVKEVENKKVYVEVAMIAILSFMCIYGIRVLNPMYVDWLLNENTDLTQHYLGWKAYRVSQWTWPLGNFDMLSYPNDTSIIFTDSIPILALIFKILSPILPKTFQYFGIWGVACFILQGVFATKILKKYLHNDLQIIIGSGFFILCPIMIFRMYMHSALAAQWLILMSMIPIVYYKEKYNNTMNAMIIWGIIGALAGAIQQYFLLMIGILLCGYCLLDVLENHSIKRSIISLLSYIISAALIVYIFGGFSGGVKQYGWGLYEYSYNLNGILNPQGWSAILKNLQNNGYEQYEGFAYLGIGIIVLLLISIINVICNSRIKKEIKNNWKIVLVYTMVGIAILFIAMSPRSTVGNQVIYTLNLPEKVFNIWSIFRTTARNVWVIVYLLMIFAICIDSKYTSQKIKTVLLCVLFAFQIYDIHSELVERHNHFANKVIYQSLLKDAIWNDVAKDGSIINIVFVSKMDVLTYYAFADFATENGKQMNNFRFSRTQYDRIKIGIEQSLSNLTASSIYIFTQEDREMCDDYNLIYKEVDGIIIGYTTEPHKDMK